jgi:hypothetical protein
MYDSDNKRALFLDRYIRAMTNEANSADPLMYPVVTYYIYTVQGSFKKRFEMNLLSLHYKQST